MSSAATCRPRVTSNPATARPLSLFASPPDVLPHACAWKRLLKAPRHCGKPLSWSATRFGLFILAESLLFFDPAGSPCSCIGGLFRRRKRTSAGSVVRLVPWGWTDSTTPSTGLSHLHRLLPRTNGVFFSFFFFAFVFFIAAFLALSSDVIASQISDCHSRGRQQLQTTLTTWGVFFLKVNANFDSFL